MEVERGEEVEREREREREFGIGGRHAKKYVSGNTYINIHIT